MPFSITQNETTELINAELLLDFIQASIHEKKKRKEKLKLLSVHARCQSSIIRYKHISNITLI